MGDRALGPPTALGRERRQTIIAAAIEVIATHGFAGASLSRVAQAAGLEKGHISYYFKTKDDLLYELIDDLHQRFLDALDQWLAEAAAEADTNAQLLHVFRSHVKLVCEFHRETLLSYESLRFLSGKRRAAVATKRYAYEVRLRAAIEDARAHTAIADVPTSFLVRSILGMLNWPYQWYSPQGSDSPDQIAQLLAERVLAALRPDADIA